MDVRKVVTEVRDLIKAAPESWGRWSVDDKDGRHCLRGFIGIALSGDPNYWNDNLQYMHKDEEVVVEFLGFNSLGDMCSWNNSQESVEPIIERLEERLAA